MAGIHHENARNIVPAGVVIRVIDVARSHCWYRDVLGLKMEMDPAAHSSRYCERYSPDSTVIIFRLVAGLTGSVTSTAASLSFQVDDLQRTVASLTAMGVVLTRPISLLPGDALSSAAILDPDGHEILLYSW